MIRSEHMAIKPQFLLKYARKYDAALSIPEIQAGIVDRMLKEKQEDIDEQFPHMFKIDGDTATINLFGPMSQDGPDWIDIYFGYNGVSFENLIRAAEEALKNDSVKQVNIQANTPGGNIIGLDEAYKSLKFLAEKRPVTVYNRGDIASAGVWYTAAAHKIIAGNPSVMIGSIGVVIDTLDFTGFYNEMGIQEISITNTDSPNKRVDLLTPEGKAVYIKELDSLYGVFVTRETSGRPVTLEAIKALKGEMIIAADAVKIGLMDEIEGESVAADSTGSNESNTNAKNKNKENLTMEEDVKQAFESTNAKIDKLVNAMGAAPVAAILETVAETGLSDADKNFCLNIANGDAYPDAIKKEAVKALAESTTMDAFKSTITVFDAMKEEKAGKDAAGEGDDKGETQPNGIVAPAGDKKKEDDGILDDEKSVKAAIDEAKGGTA